MILNEDQAKEVIKSPKINNQKDECLKHESHLRIFTEFLNKTQVHNEPYWAYYANSIENKLGLKKSKRLKDFINFPLSSIEISDAIMRKSYRVFDAQNKFFDVDLNNRQRSEKVMEIASEIKLFDFIEESAKKVMKNEPCSIALLDFDNEGNFKPILLNIERVVDLKLKNENELEYIAFKHSCYYNEEKDEIIQRYGVYDDSFFYVFDEINDNLIINEELSNPNPSGKCPARMFWSTLLNKKNPYIRKSVLAPNLGKLSEWQDFDSYKTYADTFFPWPIAEAPKVLCTVEGCHDGKIKIPEEKGGGWKDCHSCNGKTPEIGPGTIITIDPKQDKDEEDTRGIFKWNTFSPDQLEYVEKKLQIIEDSISMKAIGEVKEINMAANEKQIYGSFENRKSILIDIKNNLDKIWTWYIEQIILFEYQYKDFKIYANYGTEFYLETEIELMDKFSKAKKEGLPESEIDLIYRQYVQTKYKGNMSKIKRLTTLKEIEPLPYNTKEEVRSDYRDNAVTYNDFVIKINFTTFVDRFERENGPIINFGIDMTPEKRITTIKETLISYIQTNGENNSIQPVEPSGANA